MPVSHSYNSPVADESGGVRVKPQAHWNAPHVVSVDLASEVTGILPASHGGVGALTPNQIVVPDSGGLLSGSSDLTYNPTTGTFEITHATSGLAASASISGTINYFVDDWFTADGGTHNYRVYPVKDMPNGKYLFGPPTTSSNVTDDGSFNTYSVAVSWSAVTGADRYFVARKYTSTDPETGTTLNYDWGYFVVGTTLENGASGPAIEAAPIIQYGAWLSDATIDTSGSLALNASQPEMAPAITSSNYATVTGYSVTTGLINKNANGTGSMTPNPQLVIAAGGYYKVTITVSAVTVQYLTVRLGGISQTPLNAAGTYTYYVRVTGTSGLSLSPTNSAGTATTSARWQVTGVSVKPLIDATGDLTIGGWLKSPDGQKALKLHNGGIQFNGGLDITGSTGTTTLSVHAASGATSSMIVYNVDGSKREFLFDASGGYFEVGADSVNGDLFAIADSIRASGPASILCGGAIAARAGLYTTGGSNVSIGMGTSVTASLHIRAGTTAAGTGPLKFTPSGAALLTTPEAGLVEVLNDKIYYDIPTGPTRKEFTLNDAALTSGKVPVATTNGRLTDGGATTTELSYLSGVTSAIQTQLNQGSKTLFTQTADQTVTNTVTETSILGTGVGSKTLSANYLIAGKTIRIRIGGIYSTPALATPSVTIKVKYGSTILATVTTSSLLSGATNLEFDGEVMITCRTTGATGTIMCHGDIEYATGVAGTIAVDPLNNGGTATTIDTTTSTALDVTATWDSATSTRIAKSIVCSIEALN